MSRDLKFPLLIAIIFSIFLFQTKKEFSEKPSSFVENQLAQCSKEDLKILRETLEGCVFWDSFGYTLFGDKPMSFEVVPSFKDFWNIWEKHHFLLSSKNYFLTKIHWREYLGILIGNKTALHDVFEKNKESFQEVFGFPINAQEIIESLEKGSGEIFDIICNHHALFGILLGFGKENAWNFYQRDVLEKQKPRDKIKLAAIK